MTHYVQVDRLSIAEWTRQNVNKVTEINTFAFAVAAFERMSVKINIVEGSIKNRKCQEEPNYSGMEAVHHPEARPWIGPKYKLSEHFDHFSKLVNDSRYSALNKATTSRKIHQLMETSEVNPVTDEMFNEVMQNCDIHHFS